MLHRLGPAPRRRGFTSSSPRFHILAIALPALCACAGDTPATFERTDSAGVAILRNLGEERPLAWRFERVLTLGGVDEGPQAFARVGPALIGTDARGSIHVADAANHRIRVFDDAGNPLREMGGRGGGPGEFEFVGAFAVSDDGTVVLSDFSKHALVLFDSTGTPLPERPFDGFPGPRLRWVGDDLVLTLSQPTSAADDTSRTELLVFAAGDTTRIAAAPPQPRPEMKQLPNCPIAIAFPPLLSPDLRWDANGDRIAVVTGTDYTIDVFSRMHTAPAENAPPGTRWRLVSRVSRALPELVATAELAAQEYPDSFRIRGGAATCAIAPLDIAETVGFADVAPHIRELALGPDGSLWVRHRTGDADALRTDVFSGSGEYLGTLPPGAPFPAAFHGADRFLSIEKDEFDRDVIVVWEIAHDAAG